jgi:hypothetical protein
MGAIQVNQQQREAFESHIRKTKSAELIAKTEGGISQAAAERIIQATWLSQIFGTDEYSAEGTRELQALWLAAQASIVVELPPAFPCPSYEGDVMSAYSVRDEMARLGLRIAE